jgi:formate dehydrogenase maturation protein FdhE
MKELVVGDISVYSEDGDSWDDLIKVVRKANKAYLESIEDLRSAKKKSWIKKLKKLLKNEFSNR